MSQWEEYADATSWEEYSRAAEWCALYGKSGAVGTVLPTGFSPECLDKINDDPEAFEKEVRLFAYRLACIRTEMKDFAEEVPSSVLRKGKEG